MMMMNMNYLIITLCSLLRSSELFHLQKVSRVQLQNLRPSDRLQEEEG